MPALPKFLAASAFLAALSTAQAKVIYVDDSANGNDNGNSWANAYNSLAEAIDKVGNNDEIWVARGYYTGDAETRKNFSIYGGFDGGETVRSDRDRDAATNGTTYTGYLRGENGANITILGLTFLTESSRLYISNWSTDLVGISLPTSLDCFNCRFIDSRGIESYNQGSGWVGITNNEGEVTVSCTNCTFLGCGDPDDPWGGAVDLNGVHSVFTDCVFRDNETSTGGAIYAQDNSDVNSVMTITNCVFEENSASDSGGAIYSLGTDLTIEGCSFEDNSATFGAAINASDAWDFQGFAVLTNNNFIGGEAGTSGGGLFAKGVEFVEVSDCTFNSNAATFGGGIYCTTAELTLQDCSFTSNSASWGGGIRVGESEGGIGGDDLTVTGCSFHFNAATVEGGAVYHEMFRADSTYDDCEFVYNSAREGGAIWNDGIDCTVTDSEFTRNSATGNGGGIRHDYGLAPTQSLKLTGCDFAWNEAGTDGSGHGGAIECANVIEFTVEWCLFDANTAGEFGGAIRKSGLGTTGILYSAFSRNSADLAGAISNSSGDVTTVRGCSFGFNSASGSGGALSGSAGYVFSNTVMWGNSTDDADSKLFAMPASTVSASEFYNCLVQRYTAAELDASGSGGGGNLDSLFNSPLFRSEGDLRLGPGSPAIDGGDDFFAPESEDLDGEQRIQNGTVNIGAYESQPTRYYVKENGSGNQNGSSWANAMKMSPAFASVVHGDEIWAAAGNYSPATTPVRTHSFDLKDGVALYGGFSGFETVLLQRGSAVPSVLDGDIGADGDDSNDTYNIVTANGTGPGTLIDGFTIRGGRSNGTGGGMHLEDAIVTVRGCDFVDNEASFGGGALYASGGLPSFERCRFIDNRADAAVAFDSHGGAVHLSDTNAEFSNCEFIDNVSKTDGGAVYCKDSSVALSNVSMGWNTAGGTAGGLFYDNSSGVIGNTVIWCNSAEGTTQVSGNSMNFDGSTLPNFKHCLAEGWPAWLLDGTGGGNLEGTDLANEPRFAGPNDLRLRVGSPAIDAGDENLIRASSDLAGDARVEGAAINLGAYENLPERLFVKADATGVADGTSWANAFPHLPDAIAAAGDVDEIWVARGTYKPTGGSDRSVSFDLKDGIALHGGFAGNELTFDERDLSDAANRTVLSGNIGSGSANDNSYHVVRADNVGSSAVLDGFAIRFGRASGAADVDQHGGGLLCDNGASPTVLRCQFLSNQAAHGGAVHMRNGSPATLADCMFVGNSTTGDGGAIHLQDSSPTIVNSTIAGNHAGDTAGALYNQSASPFVSNTIAWSNTSASGDSTFEYTPDAPPQISHSLIEDNNIGSLGDGNFSGTLASNNPDFVRAPSSGDGNWATPGDNDFGDLRLQSSSPAIDTGDNAANKQPIDLDGDARIDGLVIDLGAYEGASLGNTFDSIHPGLDPDADDDDNGRSNFVDYALGEDPLNSAGHPGHALVTRSTLVFQHRTGAADAVPVYEVSEDLVRWRPMVETVDYSIVGTNSTSTRTTVTLKLIVDRRQDDLFYRQRFGK